MSGSTGTPSSPWQVAQTAAASSTSKASWAKALPPAASPAATAAIQIARMPFFPAPRLGSGDAAVARRPSSDQSFSVNAMMLLPRL